MKLAKKIVLLLLAVFLSGITMFSVADKVDAASTDVYKYEVISKKDKTCRIIETNIYGEEEVIIPSKIDGYTVVALGDELFKFNNMESVTIPSTVTTIGTECFYYADDLKTVKLYKGLKTIGDSAFGFAGLETVAIPSTVTSIGTEAFASCKNLKTVTMAASTNSVTVGSGVFEYCSSLEKADFLCNISSLPRRTFYLCGSLKEVNLSSKITEIGIAAFKTAIRLQQLSSPVQKKRFRSAHLPILYPREPLLSPVLLKK